MTDINNYEPADVHFARKGEETPPDAHRYTIGEYLLKKRGIILPSIPPGEKERLRRKKMENFYKQKKEELPFPKFMKNAVFGEQFIIKAPYYGVATFLGSNKRHGCYSFKFATVYVDPFKIDIDSGNVLYFIPKEESLVEETGKLQIVTKLNGKFDYQKMYELHAISVILSRYDCSLSMTDADAGISGFTSYIRPEILQVLEKKQKVTKEERDKIPEKKKYNSSFLQDAEWRAFDSINWREELQNCGLDLSEYFQIIEKKS